WYRMKLSLQANNVINYTYEIASRLIGEPRVSKYIRKRMKVKDDMPWVIDPNSFTPSVKVIYNTVGGSKIKQTNRQYLSRALANASFISVRDNTTTGNLGNIIDSKIDDVNVYPDSALIMSDIFSKELLLEKSTKATSTWIKREKPYLVFQVNKHIGKDKIDILAEKLHKIHEYTNLDIVLLPIGTAANHEDHIPLMSIKTKANNAKFIYLPSEENIYEIMCLIAHAKIYVGTSLHGAITSLSYNIPHLAFTDKITKLIEFIKTWEQGEELIYTDTQNMEINIKRKIDCFNYEKSNTLLKELKNKVYMNLEQIKKVIEQDTK
ncbi:polysaccharide pyruvyl transferase family protein, partial [Neobacillus niacini]|uniref:polysaccharide pyruvyl transferase family protein n=1 Tax=Neobacillus niacini TaxID=86668 RepID=UPI002DBA5118